MDQVLAEVGEKLDQLLARHGAHVDEANPAANVGLDDPVHLAAVGVDLCMRGPRRCRAHCRAPTAGQLPSAIIRGALKPLTGMRMKPVSWCMPRTALLGPLYAWSMWLCTWVGRAHRAHPTAR